MNGYYGSDDQQRMARKAEALAAKEAETSVAVTDFLVGLFEVADGGTLFLDEIGNISLSTQAKLLRFIEEREFKAVGDTKTRSVNVRLVLMARHSWPARAS
mgnify:CR=1 FL=1